MVGEILRLLSSRTDVMLNRRSISPTILKFLNFEFLFFSVFFYVGYLWN